MKKSCIGSRLLAVLLMCAMLTLTLGLQAVALAEEPVELTLYTMNGPLVEWDRIEAKANAIIKDKINATVKFVFVDGSVYVDKMNMIINSGEPFDVCFSANWGGINYFENAAKGAFADLTELIPQYAPQSYSRIPESLWQGVKVDGRIYGIVNYQEWGISIARGIGLRRDLAEKYGYDWKKLKGMSGIPAFEALEPFFDSILKNNPEMVPFEMIGSIDAFSDSPMLWGYDSVGDKTMAGWVAIKGDGTPQVVNQYETQVFADYAKMMRRWYDKGYIRKDAATIKDFMPDRKALRIAVQQVQGIPDTLDTLAIADKMDAEKAGSGQGMRDLADKKMMSHTEDNFGKAPQATVSLSDPLVPSGGPATAVMCVGATSKHPDKALQLIELLNTDDDLYKLIVLGEENVDWEYAKADDASKNITMGDFMLIPDKYNYNWMGWALGQVYSPTFNRAGYSDNAAGEANKQNQQFIYDLDKSAAPSPVMGFTFNPEPVKTQFANCSAILAEMLPIIGTGSVDPDTALPEFIQRMKAAGVDDIIKEKQAQIDAWYAANHK